MSSSPFRKIGKTFSMPFGTSILAGSGVLFRLWAPGAAEVELCLITDDESDGSATAMTAESGGWFTLLHPAARAGDSYQFRIDGGLLVPDPASRRQAHDIHGPSVVCDPNLFRWQDRGWTGRPWRETVIYELHIGTFSPQGTFAGAMERLDYLVELGVTAIELMPLAQFPGSRNWGYDGALLFAPCSCYGTPEELKNLVQTAHRKGLMVFLDVVYNHFGPEGNYLYVYAKEPFFTDEFATPWGAAIRFSGELARTVRDFYLANALYWLEEYHFDGLRFDAVHAIFDPSSPDILEEIALAVHQGPGSGRHIHLILENDDNCTRYLAREADGRPRFYTAQWNDDIHHACHVLLTGETDGYYSDYDPEPIDHLGRCLTKGFAYQGEYSGYRGRPRGEPSGHLPPLCFVSFLQNHDQIGNRFFGERLISLADRDNLRVCAALLLLAPSPPLLFMGEEFGTVDPFYFFCDFEPALAECVTRGRREEFAKFSRFTSPKESGRLPDPNAEQTFLASKLTWSQIENEEHQDLLRLYRTLLDIRRREIIPRLSRAAGESGYLHISSKALKAWWNLADGWTVTVICNLHPERVEMEPLPKESRLIYHFTAAKEPRAAAAPLPAGHIPPKSIFWFLDCKGDS